MSLIIPETAHVKLVVALAISQMLIPAIASDSLTLSGDEVLARLDAATQRRHALLTEYSVSRKYTLKNLRFAKQAEVWVVMHYRRAEGQRYTVVSRSGSDKLNGIIDEVIASEARASLPPENARYEISAANYQVRLLGTEVVLGRRCYVLQLAPRIKSKSLIVGKAWIEADSYGVVRMDGQFAASVSMLIGAPRMAEDFIAVNGYWLPSRVHAVSPSFLLGSSELDIVFSNYELPPDVAPVQ
jgi:hypothetical protein